MMIMIIGAANVHAERIGAETIQQRIITRQSAARVVVVVVVIH